jgi:hypothetical protein
MLAIRLIPPAVWEELRVAAAARAGGRPTSRVAAVAIICIWVALGLLALCWIDRLITAS